MTTSTIAAFLPQAERLAALRAHVFDLVEAAQSGPVEPLSFRTFQGQTSALVHGGRVELLAEAESCFRIGRQAPAVSLDVRTPTLRVLGETLIALADAIEKDDAPFAPAAA